MAISDAKSLIPLPAGAHSIQGPDGVAPTAYSIGVHPTVVANGDFESDTTGWLANGTGAAIARVAGGAVGGFCLQVTSGSSTTTAALSNPRFAVIPGAAYRFGAWMKLGTATGATAAIVWYNALGASIGSQNLLVAPSSSVTSSTEWRYFSAAGMAPPEAVTAQVHLVVTGAAGVTAFFDSIQVQVCASLVEAPASVEPAEPGDGAGTAFTYAVAPDAHFLGDVKVFDMGAVTSAIQSESSYTRVRGTRRKFTGALLVDNGIFRVHFNPAQVPVVHVLSNGLYTSSEAHSFSVTLDTGGDSPTPGLRQFRLIKVSRAEVVVLFIGQDGNRALLTIQRGSYAMKVQTTRVAEANAFQDFGISGRGRFTVTNEKTIHSDRNVAVGTVSVTGATLTEPGVTVFSPTAPFLLGIVMAKRPTSLFTDGATANPTWRDTGATTSPPYERTFWVWAMPWPWAVSPTMYRESNAMTLSGAWSTPADATANGGTAISTATQFDSATLEFGGDSLPRGDWTAIARVRSSAGSLNDVGVQVRNLTDGLSIAEVIATAPTAYAFVAVDFSLTAAHSLKSLGVRVRKETAAANVLYVDYVLIIPRRTTASSPSHLLFPLTLTRNLLKSVTPRETVRKV